MPEIEAGTVGKNARTMSAAAAFIGAEYMIDQNNLHQN